MSTGKSSSKQMVLDIWKHSMVAVNNQFLHFCRLCKENLPYANKHWSGPGTPFPDLFHIWIHSQMTNGWVADMPGGHRRVTHLMRLEAKCKI